MCGIGAIFSTNGQKVDQNDLNKMIKLLQHRGPDGFGSALVNNDIVGLSHVRLSIIDHANGSQPMHDKESDIYITYAGEIYDCEILRISLSAKGYKFKTASDTEVILKLYVEYGTDMFKHMNGEFSFVLWDNRRKKMIASRDRFGVKPLFFYKSNTEIVFGSEVKALIGLGRVSPMPSPDYLLSSFMGSFVGEESFYKDINTVKPGHYLLMTENQLQEHCYWKPEYINKTNMSFDDAATELRSLINQAVKRRLVTDSKMGCYLSGGIDSTIIASSASSIQPNIPCFSIGFEGEGFDESSIAKQTAQSLNMPFSCYSASKYDMADNLVNTLRHIEIPISSPQPIAMTLLSEHVRQSGVKSCITGEGADELFAGYAFFKLDQIRENKRNSSLNKFEFRDMQNRFEKLEGSNKVSLWFPCKDWERYTYKGRYDSSYNIRYQHMSNIRKRLFSEDILNSQSRVDSTINTVYSSLYDDGINGVDFNRSLSFNQMSHYVFPMQGDRVQMSHSIEGRLPFLDNDVVDFAQTLPAEYLTNLKQLQEKYILHESFKMHVPKHMINRHKQAYHNGFSWGDFTKEKRGKEMWLHYLSHSNLKKSGIFNPLFVKFILSVNAIAPVNSTIACKTNLLLGNIFTSLLLFDIMNERSLTQNIV